MVGRLQRMPGKNPDESYQDGEWAKRNNLQSKAERNPGGAQAQLDMIQTYKIVLAKENEE
jgi:hypothetical protein